VQTTELRGFIRDPDPRKEGWVSATKDSGTCQEGFGFHALVFPEEKKGGERGKGEKGGEKKDGGQEPVPRAESAC